ncbi:MAG: DNA-directed RNA polymerase [Polyangiaceae bacterium]|nr:DNA-directed RNA polymerase [Polyangiaceae bacterium]
MMTHRRLLVAALALGLGATGCAKLAPFTHELRTASSLTAEDIKNLQFYVSHEIHLRRELKTDSRQITGNHKLVVTAGKTIEEVVVEEETPGVAVEVGPRHIEISFEEGTSLRFALRGEAPPVSQPLKKTRPYAEGPNPFPGNDPEPEAVPVRESGVGGSYFITLDPGGRNVTFQGVTFEAVEQSYQAHLLIDTEALEDVVENRTVLGGRKLGLHVLPVSESLARALPWRPLEG